MDKFYNVINMTQLIAIVNTNYHKVLVPVRGTKGKYYIGTILGDAGNWIYVISPNNGFKFSYTDVYSLEFIQDQKLVILRFKKHVNYEAMDV